MVPVGVDGRPSSTAATMEVKLSSARIISEADLAMVVQDHIVIPISGFLRAGALLKPSSVMAVILSMPCK